MKIQLYGRSILKLAISAKMNEPMTTVHCGIALQNMLISFKLLAEVYLIKCRDKITLLPRLRLLVRELQ